jgi:hypothetical protein
MAGHNCDALNWCSMASCGLSGVQVGAFVRYGSRIMTSFYYCYRAIKLVSIDIELPPLNGCLAQLVERRPYKANVGGSNPSAPTI